MNLFWSFSPTAFKLQLLIIVFYWIAACSNSTQVQYKYYDAKDLEIQRICQIARHWQKQNFSIINGQVRIIDPQVSPKIFLNVVLEDGFYRCGRSDEGKQSCALGTTSFLNGQRCSFQR